MNSLSRVQLFVDPMNCSLPGSSVHGIFQARVLEWGAISYSRGSSRPGSPTLQADALPSEPPGKPQWKRICLQCRSHRFDLCIRKIPWRRTWHPTLVFLPGKSYGQGNLAGYSPQSHKESDTTESIYYLEILLGWLMRQPFGSQNGWILACYMALFILQSAKWVRT